MVRRSVDKAGGGGARALTRVEEERVWLLVIHDCDLPPVVR